jgi:Phytanoyl-CoA dioxygenase (PhyH)
LSGLSEQEFQHWCDHGYVVVPLLSETELAAAVDNIHEYMPPWEEYASHPRWYKQSVATTEGRLQTAQTFPFIGDALNLTTIHPTLVDFATRALRTERIMLSHGQLGGKYAGTRDFDQELHCDYGNNMLVVPKPDDETFDVPVLLYYTDVTVDLSPTYVVDQKHTRDDPLTPRRRSREEYPELYEVEFPVTVPAGHALLYSMRTFHRGSALRGKEGLRFAQNIGFKRCDMTWCGQVTFQHEGGRPEMDHFLEHATPRQRELAGFPPVGDPYWDKETVEAVGRRYPGMDMAPYEG